MSDKSEKDDIILTKEDWKEFRTFAGIKRLTGIGSYDLATIVLKELVDNALDEAEDCEIGKLPDGGYYVEDAGRGIPGSEKEIADTIANMFSIIRPFTSTKLFRKPTRGSLGNGLRVVTGAVIATKGSLIVSTKGQRIRLDPDFNNDGKTIAEHLGAYNKPGTRVEIHLPGLKPDMLWVKKIIDFSKEGKQKKKIYKPSPYWFDAEAFYELCESCPPDTLIRNLVAEFDGCSASTGEIRKKLGKKRTDELTKVESDALLKIMRQVAQPYKISRLQCIGVKADYFYSINKHNITISKGNWDEATIPCIVEAWVKQAEQGKMLEARTNTSLFINRTSTM